MSLHNKECSAKALAYVKLFISAFTVSIFPLPLHAKTFIDLSICRNIAAPHREIIFHDRVPMKKLTNGRVLVDIPQIDRNMSLYASVDDNGLDGDKFDIFIHYMRDPDMRSFYGLSMFGSFYYYELIDSNIIGTEVIIVPSRFYVIPSHNSSNEARYCIGLQD